MKKELLLALFALTFGALNAQVDSTLTEPEEIDTEIERIILKTEDGGVKLDVETIDTLTGEYKDTTVISVGEKKLIIVDNEDYEPNDHEDDPKWEDCNQKHDLTYWDGIDLGFGGFLDADGEYSLGDSLAFLETDLYGSRSISLNFGETKLRLIKDYVGIYTGLGIQYQSFKLKNDYRWQATTDSLVAFIDSTVVLKKNKFRSTWVNVPLMLEFNTSKVKEKNVHIAAGLVGGYNLGNMFKQKYTRGGEKEKVKIKDDFHVNPFRVDGMLRFGYGNLNLVTQLQLTEFFDTDNAHKVYPFSIGLTLVGFN